MGFAGDSMIEELTFFFFNETAFFHWCFYKQRNPVSTSELAAFPISLLFLPRLFSSHIQSTTPKPLSLPQPYLDFHNCPCEWPAGSNQLRKHPFHTPRWICLPPHLCQVASVLSDFLWPHGLQPARLLSPWDFPDKILDWVAISFAKGSSRSKPESFKSPALEDRFFTSSATWKAHFVCLNYFLECLIKEDY